MSQRLRVLSLAALTLVAGLVGGSAQAQSRQETLIIVRDIDDYVLFAYTQMNFKGGNASISHIDGDVGVNEADVQNGMEVALSIEDVDGVVLPQFRAVEQAGA